MKYLSVKIIKFSFNKFSKLLFKLIPINIPEITDGKIPIDVPIICFFNGN